MLALYLRIRNLVVAEDGQDLIEYAILLFIIAIAVIGIALGIGGWVENQFSNLLNQLGGTAQ